MHITELRDDIFYAELRFSGGVTVSARPSDAIALALRTEVDDPRRRRGAGCRRHRDPGRAGGSAGEQSGASEIVERFREFLDTISPEDFAAEGGDER